MIEIRDVDRTDETQVREFWETTRDAVAERHYNTYLDWPAAKAYLMLGRPGTVEEILAAWDGDELVATVSLFAPMLENTHVAYTSISVLPHRRREGVGSLLLQEAERRARELGRTRLTGEAIGPPEGDSAAIAFVQAHGFETEIEDGLKVADVPTTCGTWAELAAEAAPHHSDYQLITLWSPVPGELVEGYCALNEAFNQEAPSGDAEVENERWDLARVREREDRATKASRRDLFTFAIDPSGEMIGLTELLINESAPHRAFQGNTLVLPAHRGHRLGLAMKVANHQALVASWPQVEWILTGNADVNAPMNAVNERLGFQVVERCLEVGKQL